MLVVVGVMAETRPMPMIMSTIAPGDAIPEERAPLSQVKQGTGSRRLTG
jgi:hypothetical protein